MPYDELVYLLDLCTFVYQLQGQTYIWPMDPFYEEFAKIPLNRDEFMQEVRSKFTNIRETPAAPPNVPVIYRGPGEIHISNTNKSWGTSHHLDPIISDYGRIYPWRPSFIKPDSKNYPWLIYDTPKIITDPIHEVYICRYSQTNGPLAKVPAFDLTPLYSQRPVSVISPTPATDWLYCFEGGTGGIKGQYSEERYPLWGLTGIVLVNRTVNPGDQTLLYYDINIVFRGSRSGDARPGYAFVQEKGNPDWVTNTDSLGGARQIKDDEICLHGGDLNAGFVTSIKLILPIILTCLNDIKTRTNKPPRYIRVAGYSLGAGLATLFVSAIKLGTFGINLIKTFPDWPWDAIKLVTYGSPTVGGPYFKSHFQNRGIDYRRVVHHNDPVANGIYHVGTLIDIGGSETGRNAHDAFYVRPVLIAYLQNKQALNPLTPISQAEAPLKKVHKGYEVLEYLYAKEANLSVYFKDFPSSFKTYLELISLSQLKKTDTDATSAKNFLKVMQGIRWESSDAFTVSFSELVTSSFPYIKKTLGGTMHDVIGLGLILLYVCSDSQPSRFSPERLKNLSKHIEKLLMDT